jgi:hypothetical protein
VFTSFTNSPSSGPPKHVSTQFPMIDDISIIIQKQGSTIDDDEVMNGGNTLPTVSPKPTCTNCVAARVYVAMATR